MKRSLILRSSYFIIVCSFIAVSLFAIGEFTTLRLYENKVNESYKSYINYSCNNWANQFYIANREVERLAASISLNKYADSGTSLVDKVSLESELQQTITDLSITKGNQIGFFLFFPEDNKLLTSISGSHYLSSQQSLDLYEYMIANELGSNSSGWNSAVLGKQKYFIHVYHTEGCRCGAYISCGDILDDVLSENKNSRAAILNMDNSEFYALDGSDYENLINGKYYSRPVRMINKKIAVQLYNSGSLNGSPYLLWIILLSIASAGAIIAFAIRYQYKTVFLPLRTLENAMTEFSQGNIDTRISEETGDKQIRLLFHVFNNMADQISKLKINVYEEKINKEKIYARFLRVQIQPHFYTNILNLINAMANVHDDKGISELIRYVSNYFRYLLSINSDFVLLENEIQCIENYAHIQKARYKDNFDMRINCEVDSLSELIPPLVIQTFIENCFKHNIMVNNVLRISVTITDREDTYTQIQILDNGVGLPSEIVEKLNNKKDIENNGQHIGIYNVISRLDVLYGGSASIHIENTKPGASITIIIPKKLMEDNEDERETDGYFDCR